MVFITGATGHLGGLLLDGVLKTTPAEKIAILARDKDKAGRIASKGVTVKIDNYDDYDSLVAAFTGIDKLYFVSGNEMEKG